MLTVKDGRGKTATIDSDFKTDGDKLLAGVLDMEIMIINPEDSQAANPLAYLFYELQKMGFEVEAEPEDLDDWQIPRGAIS